MIPNNNTTSLAEESLDEWRHTTVYDNMVRILITSVGFIGILNNTLVFLVVARVRTLRSLSNFYVISQAVIDFVCASVVFFLHLIPVFEVPGGIAGELLCRLWVSRYLMWASFNASTYNLMTLTMERYFAILYPFEYVAYFNVKKATVLLIVVWTLAFTFSSYALHGPEHQDDVATPATTIHNALKRPPWDV
ncbi:D(2) dopamine receptor-like [Ptychodera flava]|uniref:D(2) dopamine receptor-like n=1 Tax=Ptychodera flava TaxID=63121 RepID=UPI00396A141E